MDAKKCDRCGEFYIKDKSCSKLGIGFVLGFYENDAEFYDLCSECTKKAKDWIKGKNERTE